MRKGFSQIDLAIAVSLMIFMVALAFLHTGRQITGPLAQAESFQARNDASSLFSSVFDGRGSPDNWYERDDLGLVIRPSLGEYVYRTKIRVVDTGGTDQSADVSAIIHTDERGYNTTFAAYDGSSRLPTDLTSTVDSDSDSHPEEVNITFTVSVDADSEKLIYVYYSNDTTIDSTYTSLTQDESNLTISTLSTERITGLTPRKLDSINNFTNSQFKDRFALTNDFRIEADIDSWSYGFDIPSEVEVLSSRRNLMYQNETGHINFIQARVFVW